MRKRFLSDDWCLVRRCRKDGGESLFSDSEPNKCLRSRYDRCSCNQLIMGNVSNSLKTHLRKDIDATLHEREEAWGLTYAVTYAIKTVWLSLKRQKKSLKKSRSERPSRIEKMSAFDVPTGLNVSRIKILNDSKFFVHVISLDGTCAANGTRRLTCRAETV